MERHVRFLMMMMMVVTMTVALVVSGGYPLGPMQVVEYGNRCHTSKLE